MHIDTSVRLYGKGRQGICQGIEERKGHACGGAPIRLGEQRPQQALVPALPVAQRGIQLR